MLKNNSTTESAKEDIEGIKKDIASLVKRLGGIKDKSSGIMSEQLDSLSDTIAELKNKGEEKGKDILNEVSISTLEHPVRNLLYAFGAGVILAILIK